MRSVLLGSLRRYGRRYVAAALAVIVAVAFLVVTNALVSAARSGLTQGVGVPYAGADAVVRNPSGEVAADVVARADREGAEALVLGWSTQPVRRAGTVLADDADIAPISLAPRQRWQELRSGRFPTRSGEAVVDANAAKEHRVSVGDRLQIGTGAQRLDATVVGTVDTPSIYVAGAVYLPWEDAARWADRMYVDSVLWAGSGTIGAQIAELQRWFPDESIVDRDTQVAERKVEVDNGVDIMAIIALLFVAIAAFVAVLVIANTFTILFAQRTRDLALLRCVGGTRRQLLRSVRIESLAIGVGASLLGLGIGTALGYGVVAGVEAASDSFSLGPVALSPVWLLGAFGMGVATTVLAAWLPTRRVVRVSPLQALRPETTVLPGRTAGWLRWGSAGLLLAAGTAALVLAMAEHSMPVMVVGGAAVFTGVLVLGPVLVPALVRLLGGVASRLGGAPARLATRNTVRNPRRAAATAAALLIGVTLTTAVLTGLATSRGAIAAEMDRDHPVDVALTSTDGDLPADLSDAVRRVTGVADVADVPGVRAESEELGSVTAGTAPGGTHADDAVRPERGVALVPIDLLPDGEVPRRVTFHAGGRDLRLEVELGSGWGNVVLLDRRDLATLTAAPTTQAVWVRATEDADAEDLVGDLTALAGDLEVESGIKQRAYVDLQLDIVTGAVVGLLGISVLIALVGIGNTLGLSVVERSREHAMLRAVGLTRRQLRASLMTEAALLSVVATLVGVALGLWFAWVAVRTAVEPVTPGVALALPWGQLGTVVGVSALAGLTSAVLPARRAARATPAAGLAD
ncbi:ABC transporter permease [Nocardioides daejeonensis]|uniref:ABC transporter permease n=1 Tax=Nocardioides daejeonensis TaxID=1046556 RepID=UPI000D74011D|nr:ABC transporter permease [Nocardioides daejeonensis]